MWGVRGSIPTPNSANLRYGGNTTCLEFNSREGERIIVDAGTGSANLGRSLVVENGCQAGTGSLDLHLFLTHFHWDHIQGLPFFAPLLKPGNKVTFYSFPSEEQIRERLGRQMADPFFTLDFNAVPATREFHHLANETLVRGDIAVTSFPLHHPQGASGYRIEAHGAAVVVATDMEHGDPVFDKELLRQADGADLLICDAQYTPAEYAGKRGWGHSTYAAAAKFAKDAGVKKLLLFHHDPSRDDMALDGIVDEARSLFENVSAARENCCLDF